MIDWPIVILAVDPGQDFGWSIWNMGTLAMSGHGKLFHSEGLDNVVRVMRYANETAAKAGAPLFVVGESWGRGGRMNPETAAGLGAAWGPWNCVARSTMPGVGLGLPASRVLRVHQRTWRSALFSGNHKTAAWKKLAFARVNAMRRGMPPIEHDGEAEAILIGRWATKSKDVGKKLPKKLKTK